jgi:nicotinamidase-related amidase
MLPRLLPASSLVLLVDVQERLAQAMPADAMERLVYNTRIVLEAARLLSVRVVATEQYPKGLGPTVAPLAEKLGALGVTPVSKLDFSALGEPAVARAIETPQRPRAVILAGMETHVCVFQTARELAHRGYTTFVLEDAVASRREENRQAGLALCARAGAVPIPTESVVFDWLGRAEGDAFKAISKLVK